MDVFDSVTAISYVFLYIIIFIALIITIRGAAYIRQVYYDYWYWPIHDFKLNHKIKGYTKKIYKLKKKKDHILDSPTYSQEQAHQLSRIENAIGYYKQRIDKIAPKPVEEKVPFIIDMDIINLSTELLDKIDELIDQEFEAVISPDLITLKSGERLNVTKYDEYVSIASQKVFDDLKPEVFSTQTIYSEKYLMNHIATEIERKLMDIIAKINQT